MSGSTIKTKATLIQRVALFFETPLFPWLAGLGATLLVACTIDLADDFSWSVQGPGLTFDEGFNVETGVYLCHSLGAAGLSAIHPETLQEIYSNQAYHPDHPPLGRLAIGIAQAGFRQNAKSRAYEVSAARMASAVEFGLLVFLLSHYTRRWFGPLVSAASTVSVICMPRVFAHAHLASLETCTILMYTAFVLVIADRWPSQGPVAFRRTLRPGLILGLALLTKIHAILLLPVLLIWGLWNWGFKSLPRLFLVVAIGFAVFLIGWPWLWTDAVAHLKEYFARATERSSLNCFYLGEKFADRDVPWHYPFVMFSVTMPVGFLIAGFIGLANRTGEENSSHALFDSRTQLVFGAWLLPLIVFALPGVTVYDGVRLFLMCDPLFSIFVGLGTRRLLAGISHRTGPWLPGVLVLLAVTGPIYNLIVLHPCQLSYYNEAVAGLGGADRLGFETTYWGDSVTPEFLEQVVSQLPQGATLEVAPVLHPLQLEFMRQGSWLVHRPDIELKAFDHRRSDLSPHVLVIRRKADPWSSLLPPPAGTERLGHVERQGVILTEFLRLPTPRSWESVSEDVSPERH